MSSLFIQNNAYASVWLDQIDQGVRVGTTHTHTHTHTQDLFWFSSQTDEFGGCCVPMQTAIGLSSSFVSFLYHFLSWLIKLISSGNKKILYWLCLGMVFNSFPDWLESICSQIRFEAVHRGGNLSHFNPLWRTFRASKGGFLGQKFRENFSFEKLIFDPKNPL